MSMFTHHSKELPHPRPAGTQLEHAQAAVVVWLGRCREDTGGEMNSTAKTASSAERGPRHRNAPTPRAARAKPESIHAHAQEHQHLHQHIPSCSCVCVQAKAGELRLHLFRPVQSFVVLELLQPMGSGVSVCVKCTSCGRCALCLCHYSGSMLKRIVRTLVSSLESELHDISCTSRCPGVAGTGDEATLQQCG